MLNAYNFDKIVYKGNFIFDFYLFCLKRNKKILLYLPVQIWNFILYALGIKDETYFNQKAFSFINIIDNINEYIYDFWEENFNKINPWYLSRNKNINLIISSVPIFLLKPLEKKLNAKIIKPSVCSHFKIKKFYTNSTKKPELVLNGAKIYLVDKNKAKKINPDEVKMPILVRIFFLIFALIFILFIIGIIFNNKTVLEVATTKNNIIAAILGLFLFPLIYLGIYKINTNKKRNLVIYYSVFTVIFICLQLLVLYFAKNSPGWDWKVVYDSAQNFAIGNYDNIDYNYFSTFPNNKYLFVIEAILFTILNKLHLLNYSLLATHILNLIFVFIAFVLTILTVKKLFGNKNSLFAMILMLLSSAFYLYLPVFYTDTLALPIPIAILYCYLNIRDMENGRKKIFLALLIGFLSVIGIKIKFTTIIVLIGIIINLIFRHQFRKNIKTLGIIMLTIICFLFSLRIAENNVSFFKATQNGALPYSHWIMMGMYEYPSDVKNKNFIGVYNKDLYEYTYSLKTRENMIDGHIKKIKEKLSDYKVWGYLDFLYRKALFTWGDGTYHGSRTIAENRIMDRNIVQEVVCPDGKYFNIYYIKDTALIIFLYFSLVVGALAAIIKKRNDYTVIYITLFGLIIFLSLWESSARYLVHYVPILIVASIPGISFLTEKLRK